MKFDPNAPAQHSGIFGLPFNFEESKLILIPVPWEATTSYGGGTSKGPAAILEASHQVDLFDLDLGAFYKAGIFLLKEDKKIRSWNLKAKREAQKVIKGVSSGGAKKIKDALGTVNDLSVKLNNLVYNETKKLLSQDKIVGLLGGDHSTPFGAIKAYTEAYPHLGILHFDAHADMRKEYEGFSDSHASIMYNVISKTKLKTLVQVGIRDFCEEEFKFIKSNEGLVFTFFDQKTGEERFSGKGWNQICQDIIKPLPNEVYISFDIDGLSPDLCPNTGTPVPGGLSFQQAAFLIKAVVLSGRKIVGFDLNEVAPDPSGSEWDANVGARLLYKMCGWTLYNK